MRSGHPASNPLDRGRAFASLVVGVLVTATTFVAPATSGVGQQVPIGPRAIAMGGAFSSIADDATALFWNPAGLARIGHQEVTGAHANLFDSGITDNFAAFVLPLSLDQAVAIDWYHSGFEDRELGFGENRIDFSYARRLGSVLSAGATVKYLTLGTDLDGSSVSRGRGAGMDLGVLVSPLEGLRLGLLGQDITGTRIGDSDGSSVVYPRNLRAGISYDYRRLGTAAFDVDDRWHVGFELTPIEQVALRAGLEDDREGSERPTFTYGAGFKVGVMRLDYALVDHPALSSTHHFGLAMQFNFNPSLVRIEKVAARDLYASLYKTYAREGVGSAVVRNLQDHPVAARVKVFIPELMETASEQDIVLRPKAAQEVPLTAVISETVLSRAGDRPIQVQVSATYQSRRLMRTEKSATQCLAYGPGAIHWGEGVDQAAAFVTLNDPAVDALAREATGIVARRERDPLGNRPLSFAAALLDALAVLGVAYVPDPNNPFTSISETPHAVDTIHYPAETLETRVGDCDDTSVLMAALLGNVGVATQFVDAPGHLFLLVDTGVHARNRLALGVDENLLVLNDDEVWIPLETTAIGKGFAEAWRIGAEAYASLAARGRVRLVDVARAQSRYEPAAPPARRKAGALDATALATRLDDDASKVAAWKGEYLASHFGEARRIEISDGALAEIAHVYYLAGRLDEARTQLEEILKRDPRSAAALNNLAGLCLAQGEARRAIEHGEAALAIDRADPGIRLNLGLALHFAGDTTRAMRALAEGVLLSGGYASACKLLGLRVGGGEARQEPTGTSAARRVLDAATGGEAGSAGTKGAAAPSHAAPRAEDAPPATGGAGPGRAFYWKP